MAGGIGPLMRPPWRLCSQAWASMPTERDRMNRPRPSAGAKPSSQKDDGGGAIDVHGNARALAPFERLLDCRADLRIAPGNCASLVRRLNQSKQPAAAR